MTQRHFFEFNYILGSAAILALCAGAALAGPDPIGNPHGTVSGTVDGHVFDLPVRCETRAGALDVSSHDRTISRNVSIGGVEPAVNIIGLEQGLNFVIFIGGTRYKFLSTRDTIETFPFVFSREVKDKEHGKIDVEFTIDCPTP